MSQDIGAEAVIHIVLEDVLCVDVVDTELQIAMTGMMKPTAEDMNEESLH